MNFSFLSIHVNDTDINVSWICQSELEVGNISNTFPWSILLPISQIFRYLGIFLGVPPSSRYWDLTMYIYMPVSLSPARYHPKLNFLEGDLVASIRARRLIIKLAKSVNKWAASDIMAKLPANTPPANISFHILCE